jgi:hypothetical protein
MDDALVVRRLEGEGDLVHDRERIVQRDGTVPDAIGERRTLDQFKDERVHGPAVLEAVDLSNVGMIERREHARLSLKPRQPVGIGGKRVREDLQRDIAAELGVASPVHLAHATGANDATHLIRTETCAGRQLHRLDHYGLWVRRARRL